MYCRFLTRPSEETVSCQNSSASECQSDWQGLGLSADTRRQLLLSQSSVTARFEAEKLWQQGYNGAKVKVGVFDTGIRADHPHVKNIRSATMLNPFTDLIVPRSKWGVDTGLRADHPWVHSSVCGTHMYTATCHARTSSVPQQISKHGQFLTGQAANIHCLETEKS